MTVLLPALCPYSDHAADDNAAKFVSVRITSQDVACERTFGICRLWLRMCSHEHRSCEYVGEDWTLPKLVEIDWQSLEAEPRLQAINGTSMESATTEYVAMSYCWAEKSSMEPLRTALSKGKWEVPFHKLPKTLQDAVIITCKLGFRYIWIDCL